MNMPRKSGNKKLSNSVLIAIIAVVIFLIPLLIHFIYVSDYSKAIIIAKWTAGELLVYFGTVLGSITTLITIVMTINFTRSNQSEERKFVLQDQVEERKFIQQNQREERRLSIKPFLQSDFRDLPGLPEEDNIIYVQLGNEVRLFYNYRRFDDEKVGNEQAQILRGLNYARGNHVIRYNLFNVGIGSAVNVCFRINNRPIGVNYALSTNFTKTFIIIFSEELLLANRCELNFEFSYTDVATFGRYIQRERMVLSRDEHENLIITRNMTDLLSNPEEIMEDQQNG